MSGDVKISCRNMWKVFGQDPEGFMAAHGGSPTAEAMQAEGYIGAVRDVSFDVHAGEILIIMGLSGSGKSTVIRCITRLNDPTSGEVIFDGSDILAANEQEMIELRRHKMGMVFQNFGLLPHRNVLSNVAFPLEVQGLERGHREARAREMIELVGLGGREEYFPRELSGGQQQRVAIARALAGEPRFLLADEPTGNLDSNMAESVMDLLTQINDQGTTIIMVTHEPSLAERAERNIHVRDGQVYQGEPGIQLAAQTA